MTAINPELIGAVHSFYKRASDYLKVNNPHLSETDRIVLGNISEVINALSNFLTFSKLQTKQEQLEVIELIFDLHRCRDEATEIRSGAFQDHIQARNDFFVAAKVIKTVMDANPRFCNSDDVKELYEFIWQASSDTNPSEEPKNYQPTSRYGELIYQIVLRVREAIGKERVKGIYAELDSTLFAIYPAGLRRSRSLSALEDAYKTGRERLQFVQPSNVGTPDKGSSGKSS